MKKSNGSGDRPRLISASASLPAACEAPPADRQITPAQISPNQETSRAARGLSRHAAERERRRRGRECSYPGAPLRGPPPPPRLASAAREIRVLSLRRGRERRMGAAGALSGGARGGENRPTAGCSSSFSVFFLPFYWRREKERR